MFVKADGLKAGSGGCRSGGFRNWMVSPRRFRELTKQTGFRRIQDRGSREEALPLWPYLDRGFPTEPRIIMDMKSGKKVNKDRWNWVRLHF